METVISRSKKRKTLFSLDANLSVDSTTENFYAYRGDLNKDGKSEIVIADLQGVTNGVGISNYDINIFERDSEQNFHKTLTFPIREFGEKGNFIFDKFRNETLILVTYWDWFETLDRKRGDGFYLVGKWFRYRKKHLQPVFEKPTLARRYLNSFQELRWENYGNPNAPYLWLTSKNTHRFFIEPKDSAKLVETKYGIVKSIEGDEVTIRTEFGETSDYSFGCCPVDFRITQRITIKDFGHLPRKFIYPNVFYNFSPSMVFETVKDKKVKLEVYETKYKLKYVRLWFLEQ